MSLATLFQVQKSFRRVPSSIAEPRCAINSGTQANLGGFTVRQYVLCLIFAHFACSILTGAEVRAMRGHFTGVAALGLVDRNVVWSWLPAEVRDRVTLDFTDRTGQLHPVAILAGSQKGVQVQRGFRGRFVSLPALQSYQEAFVLIPYLKEKGLANAPDVYTFSRIYVNNETIVNLGRRENDSPKVFARISNERDLFSAISGQGKEVSVSTSHEDGSMDAAVAKFVKGIFAQTKLEMVGGQAHHYDFNFFKSVDHFEGSEVSATIEGHELLPIADNQVLGFRFSVEWAKNPLN